MSEEEQNGKAEAKFQENCDLRVKIRFPFFVMFSKLFAFIVDPLRSHPRVQTQLV